MDMNPEILSFYLLGAELAREGGWFERLSWLDPVDVEAEAGEAVVAAMSTSDGGKSTLAYVARRVEWRLLDVAKRRRSKRERSLTRRDEQELATSRDAATREVEDRDEREVLRAWLGRQGRDGEIVERRLAGETVEEIGEAMGMSGRQVRRVLDEVRAVALRRFRV